jgi:CheY-like chemotaxis protein
MRVLVIDDDNCMRRGVALMLQNLGHEAIEADSGFSGLEIFHSKNPDVVVTDIIMPGIEGIEAIFRLKASNPKTRIVAMSGGGSVSGCELLKLAHRAGATSILSKPFSKADLAYAIEIASRKPDLH